MENEPTTHECRICGRIFEALDAPEICNKCLNDAHKYRPRPDTRREVRRDVPESFIETWTEYEREYE